MKPSIVYYFNWSSRCKSILNLFKNPLERAEVTLVGTSVHGCARTARDVVDVADETVDTVKRPEDRLTKDGLMDIAPLPAAVAFARMVFLPIVWRANCQFLPTAT